MSQSKGKRDRENSSSSEGASPSVLPPVSKQVKVVEGSPVAMPEDDIRDMFRQKIMKGQEQTRTSLESLFDKQMLILTVMSKGSVVVYGLLEEAHAGCSSWRTEQLSRLVEEVQSTKIKPPFDTSKTVIVTGLAEEESESLINKAQEMIDALEQEMVQIVNCMRLKSKIKDNTGLVKVELESEKQKVEVLKAKKKLQEYPGFSKVFIRGSKSYAERLMESNTRMLLKGMLEGHKFRVTSGIVVVQRDNYTYKKGEYSQVKNRATLSEKEKSPFNDS
jgi:hypothetical protein